LALCSPGREILERFSLPALVITCGAAGILAILPQGSLWARTPPQPETNAAGAGDAASAALVWRFSLGDEWESALRWAAAASAAVVLTEATADCRWEDIQRLYPASRVEWLEKV
jgi:fructose-1-phosphate kinase PfkB-like protein